MTDFVNYYPFYDNLNTIFNITSDELFRYEPGFIIYSSLIKTLSFDYHLWVLCNTLIDVLILNYIFKKYSVSIFLSWFFFIAYMGMIMEFNMFRNIKAIELFLLSIPYIQKRNLKKFLIINIIAISFHISAILYIPVYFFLDKNLNKKFVYIVFIIVNLIYFLRLFPTTFIFELLGEISPEFKMLRYANGEDEIYGFSLGYFEKILTFILCLIFYDKLENKRLTNRIFCNAYFIYFVLFYLFADVPSFTSRMPLLFIFSIWIIIPNIMGLIHSKYKSACYAIILLYGFIKITMGHSDILYKYDNIITGYDSYQKREQIVMKLDN